MQHRWMVYTAMRRPRREVPAGISRAVLRFMRPTARSQQKHGVDGTPLE